MKSLAFRGRDDWAVVESFLPAGWEEQARELGALRRARGFEDPSSLLRTLMIHLADGCSLRETAARAKKGGVAAVSDVALLKRLRTSGEWFRWMAAGVMKDFVPKQPTEVFGAERCVRLVDATVVLEPGKTGSTWRIHYSVGLPTLECTEVHVTTQRVGETLKRFAVEPGDVLLGDRGYAHPGGIGHVIDSGGDVLVRLNLSSVPLLNEAGEAFALLEKLRSLQGTALGDYDVFIRSNGILHPGRVCAIRKSRDAARKARLNVRRAARANGHEVRDDTVEAAGYIFVFTTLPRGQFSPTRVLETYRGRWQVELAFKRLKSLIGLGHLRKRDQDGAKAWIHGKLLVAFLIEAMITAGESFFPWGYPIREEVAEKQVNLERDVVHATTAEPGREPSS